MWEAFGRVLIIDFLFTEIPRLVEIPLRWGELHTLNEALPIFAQETDCFDEIYLLDIQATSKKFSLLA